METTSCSCYICLEELQGELQVEPCQCASLDYKRVHQKCIDQWIESRLYQIASTKTDEMEAMVSQYWKHVFIQDLFGWEWVFVTSVTCAVCGSAYKIGFEKRVWGKRQWFELHYNVRLQLILLLSPAVGFLLCLFGIWTWTFYLHSQRPVDRYTFGMFFAGHLNLSILLFIVYIYIQCVVWCLLPRRSISTKNYKNLNF